MTRKSDIACTSQEMLAQHVHRPIKKPVVLANDGFLCFFRASKALLK